MPHLWHLALFMNLSFGACSVHQLPLHDIAVPEKPPSVWLDDIRARYRLPGLAAGHLEDDRFLHKVSGIRRQGSAPMAQLDDQWHLGSLTKAMTATLLALLIKDGLFSWDTLIGDLFPELEIDPAHRSTNLSAIASHRAGIDININNPVIAAKVLTYSKSPAEGRYYLVKEALLNPPKLPKYQFKYENTDYDIAGSIIDRYSGMIWEDFLQKRLFDPLNMTRCGLGPNDERSGYSVDNPWPHLSSPLGPIPYLFFPFELRDSPPALASEGNVHCPIESYMRFLQLHANARSGQPNALNLSREDFKALHTPLWIDDGPDHNAYTPGAWWVTEESVENSDPNNYELIHTGTNLRNYAMSLISVPEKETGKIFLAATNVGLARDAVDEVVQALKSGYSLRE